MNKCLRVQYPNHEILNQMPIILNELTPCEVRILIWNIQETEEDLKKFLNVSEKSLHDLLSGINHAKRRKQKIVTNLLLGMLSSNALRIYYSAEGKPILPTFDGHISISHSGDYVVLIFHLTKIVGVDIEIPDERVINISSRFINESEYLWASISKETTFSLIWGVKESIFKAIGGGGIDFKKNIIVSQPYENMAEKGKGCAIFSKNELIQNFQYHFRYLESYLLVYTIAEN